MGEKKLKKLFVKVMNSRKLFFGKKLKIGKIFKDFMKVLKFKKIVEGKLKKKILVLKN